MHATTSLWLDRPVHAKDLTAGPLEADVEVDVAIVGGGIVGAATAALLAESELRTVLLEARTFGSGTTGNSTAKMTLHQGTQFTELLDSLSLEDARLVVEADQAALNLISSRCGGDLARQVTGWAYATSEDGRATLERERDAAAQLGVRAQLVDADASPIGVAALGVGEQLLVEPALLCRELIAQAVDQPNASVHQHTRIVEVTPGELVTLETNGGRRIRARQLVLATHVPILDRTLVFAACTYRRSHVIALDAPGISERFPDMYTGVDTGTLSLRPARTALGDEVLVVAGNGHGLRDDEVGTHLDDLERSARELIGDDAVGRVTHAWLAHDAFPGDGRPFIGPARGLENVSVAVGFAGWGLARGVAAAMSIVAHIRRGHSQWAHPFDAARLGAFARTDAARSAVDSIKGIVVDRVTAPGIEDIDSLRPGEGGVFRDGVRAVAAARGLDGSLHVVDAACTHLGCLVRHDAERSEWQCPCHGSRFSLDGAVLAGPATRPLEQVSTRRLDS